ncbi:MAG: amino acid adenylation domain-containing protein [Pseudomonadota bacterium]
MTSNIKHYSLSSPQLDFWFDQILHPGVPLYNIGGYVRIEGTIDPALFEKALNQVIAENDALRIILHEGESLPTQTFAENVHIKLDFHDFSETENAHESALKWMEQEFVKPFQLYDKLLFQFALCKASERCYYWLKKYHHLIVDGWGISLIVQRVAAAYNALVTGQTGEPKNYAYPDFIQNDQAYLESKKFVKAQRYWQEKYSEVPKPLLVRRYAAQFKGKTIPSQRSTLCLKRSFYNQLNEFAFKNKVSTFHVILGALYCYFVRTCRRDDFAIGLPMLNRNSAAFKQTAGVFTGISPAWFRFGTDLSFIELLENIHKELQKGYRHQRFPLGEIHRQIGLHSNQQLFDITLSYAKHDYDAHFNGNPIQAVFFANGFYPQGHALFIFIEEFHQHDDVNIYFDYNLSFFNDKEIERLKGRLEFLLGEVLRQPSLPVRELQIIPDAELKKQIKFHHNGFACQNLEKGIQYVKEMYDVTHISEIVFDERQNASVCLIEANNNIHIELVAGNQVETLLNRSFSLYHVCYEVSDFFLTMEKFIAKGASVISEPKPAPLFNNRLVTFLNTHLGLVELLEETKSLIYEEPEQQTIAITATFTAEPLKESLDFWMQELDMPFKIEFAPYNQVFQQLLDSSSMLSQNETGINVVLVRFEDWTKSEDEAMAEIEHNVLNFVQALKSAVKRHVYLVCICPASPTTEHGNFYLQMEKLLASELEGISSLYLVKSEDLLKSYPVSRFDDPHGEELGHIPYTPVFFTALGTMIARKIHAIKRNPYKVIVLDCDGTLWQGVCAEEGPLNLKIDSTHQALQTLMVAQQQAGILLCLCSKNNEADVFAVFEQRSNLFLKREHLVSWRINWQAKSANIKSLSEELNLGLSSFIFIDDNPLECAEVQAHCPAVTTIQLPSDINHIPQFINNIWAFDQLKITTEDQQRTKYYQQNLQRDRWHQDALTFADFIAGLELEIEISAMTASQLNRVSQLTQRINQFNFTTIRRTEAEIQQLCEAEAFESLVVKVRDRFGDYGLVGVILFESVANAIRVDTFLLSCRALGRGVEHQMLAKLGQIAKERHKEQIEILYIPTERNQLVLDFLENVGSQFKQPAPEGWQFNLPARLVSELTYSPPEISSSHQKSPTITDGNGETEIQSHSTLFNHIATELSDAEQILTRIKSQNQQSQKATKTYVAPRTTEEELLAGIWADVLGLERVGVHDNFFSVGGHSLIGTQVMSRIRDTFAVGLPLHLLFELPTIAQLSTRLNTKSRDSSLSPITRVERDKPLQLSFAQQRLWFLDQLEGKSATYNIVAAVRLEGQLNPQALEQSFQALVQRHESLRTTFPTINGAPVVHISEEPFQLAILDLRALSRSEQDSEVQGLLKEEAMRPFDLVTGPLFRAKLFQLGETSHILQVNMHHIIADAWSLGVFVREWRIVYEAALTNQTSSLPPLPIQYVDFAHWQRQWLTGEVLEKQIKYWKQQLADVPALLELPTDYPRPPMQGYQGASLSFSLSPELTSQLKHLSQQTGTTLFMTLWSAFAILLYRYSGQSDIVIGSPIANRTHSEIESLIGFFVNTLVLRLDLAENPPFEDVLRQARQVALDAYAHQDIPFEQLVEALQPERNLSHSPLFQVMFVLQNANIPDLELAGLSLTLLELESVTAKFDLTLELTETTSGLSGKLEYNTDLFERATIKRLSGHLQTLLTGIVENPKTPTHELPLLTKAEQQQLLAWNDTATDYPQDLCIHQLFEAQVETTPEAVAVVFENQQVTYRELNTKANQLAHYLQTLGVKPEVLVGICVERSIEMVIGLFGILKAGGAYLPLDPAYPAARLAFMLEDAQVPVLLTQSSLKKKLPETQAQVVCLDVEAETLSQLSSENIKSGVASENLAYVIYTSGSTGKPKGVMISHQALCNHTQWMLDTFPLNDKDKVLQKTPISFDASVWEFYAPLVAGAQLVIAQPDWQKDSRSLIEMMAQHQVTTVQMVPSLLQVIISLTKIETIKSLKRIFCGGEILPVTLMAETLNILNIELINLYGPTEACIDATFWRCFPNHPIVPIGSPIANTQIYILDLYLQPVPVGVPGELHIGGAGVARGYLNRPDLTAEKLIKNPFSDDPNSRLYKTGDLARYLPDGNIEYLGRIDNQVKIRGFRIELGEIEAVLAQHQDVRENAVIVHEASKTDKRLVAYLVPPQGQVIENTALRDFLRERLPDYMIPSVFVMLENLPLTPNGKIDRRALSQLSVSNYQLSEKTFVAPRTPEEELLAGIWASVLGIERVGVHDNFFDLGGHSLLAVSLLAQIEQQFGQQLPLSALFQGATIAELALQLKPSTDTTNQWSPLVAIQPNGSKRPFFCVPGAGGNVLYYHQLAHHLGQEQPFYGLQAVGLDGETAPDTRVEDMAARYIKEIQTIQPKGPYLLGGHSFGSWVALEMSKQLQLKGQKVARLAVFDTTVPFNQPIGIDWDETQWITDVAHIIGSLLGRKLDISYAEFIGLKNPEKLSYLHEILEQNGWFISIKQLQALVKIFKANCQTNYVPQAIEAIPISLFKASETPLMSQASAQMETFSQHLKQETSWGWSQYAEGLVDIHVVPGDHHTMMNQPHVQVLAEKLKVCLEQTLARYLSSATKSVFFVNPLY